MDNHVGGAPNIGRGGRHCHAKPGTRPHFRPVRANPAIRDAAARSRSRGADRELDRASTRGTLSADSDRSGAGAGPEGGAGSHHRARGEGQCGAGHGDEFPRQCAESEPVGRRASWQRAATAALHGAVDPFAATGCGSSGSRTCRRQFPAHGDGDSCSKASAP